MASFEGAPGTVIGDEEALARFVMRPDWVRQDLSLRPDAFIPYPYPELSVTRHLHLSQDELWKTGAAVATTRSLPLIGRADLVVASVHGEALEVRPDPIPENPNHAVVIGWPFAKPSQKIIAQRLSRAARFVAAPAVR